MEQCQKDTIIYYLRNPKLDQYILKEIEKYEEEYLEEKKVFDSLLKHKDFFENELGDDNEVKKVIKKNIESTNTLVNNVSLIFNTKYSSCLDELKCFERIKAIKSILNPYESTVIKMYYEDNLPMRSLESHFGKDHKNMTKLRDKIVEAITYLYNDSISNEDIVKLKTLPYNNKKDKRTASR